MSTIGSGHYFDGRHLRAVPVEITVDETRLQLSGRGVDLSYALVEVRVDQPLANLPRHLYLPDGGSVEIANQAVIDALRSQHPTSLGAKILHWLESRALVAAGATVGLVAGIVFILLFGLPVLARHAARAVPAQIETQIGEAGLRALDAVTRPSQLKGTEWVRVLKQFERLRPHLEQAPPALRLQFRSMPGQPNALALPGGIVVVSDELLALAGSDDEIAAVLAHEIGHLRHQHGLQTLLQSSAALLLVSSLTGDLSALTNFAAVIPTLLLQRGYSREFEYEADAYAQQVLDRAGIELRHYALVLARLEQRRGTKGRDVSYLSSHPATAERIRRLNPTGGWDHLTDINLPSPTKSPPPPVKSAPPAAIAQTRPEPVISTPAVPVADGKSNTARPSQPPRLLQSVPPSYPKILRAAGLRGQVLLEFVVDAQGNVRNAFVVKSTHRGFESAALAAVTMWKFEPGRLGDRAVNTRVQQAITFNLGATASDRQSLKPPPPWPTGPGWPLLTGPRYTYPPLARVRATPEYPARLKAAGVEGRVTVSFFVDATGTVRSPQVIKSTNPEFDPHAKEAILKWVYEPALLYDRPVGLQTRHEFIFDKTGAR